jgi:uncharacterized protein YecE (DUF72 family)
MFPFSKGARRGREIGRVKMKKSGTVRAGMGGWTFEPWRGTFYPDKLPHAKELAFASQHVPTIEVNGTFYRTQTPATFAKWASETPDGFVFALKGPRYAVNRRVLAEAGDSIKRFVDSGPLELGAKLGPMLWQFAATKKFDAVDFSAFLALLPHKVGGAKLRHVVEVRHETFCTPEFIKLARQHAVPIVFAEHATYPAIPDITGDFVYARLQKGEDEVKTGYPPKALDAWAKRFKTWGEGGVPDDLPLIDETHKPAKKPRDAFVYFIHEGKVRAPHAAMALMQRVG